MNVWPIIVYETLHLNAKASIEKETTKKIFSYTESSCLRYRHRRSRDHNVCWFDQFATTVDEVRQFHNRGERKELTLELKF